MVNKSNSFLFKTPYPQIKKRLAFSLQSCQLCDEALQDKPFLCNNCHLDLPRTKIMCANCCLPLELKYSEHDTTTLICGECLAYPPSFTKAVCPFIYTFPVIQLIRQIKYSKQRYWVKFFSWALNKEYLFKLKNHTVKQPDFLVPIPMHKSKIKIRGYNQAELIAQSLAKKTGIPIKNKALIKTSPTDTQTQLNKQERMQNLKHSFAIAQKEFQRKNLKGKHIALVDDVMTTKATCELASRLLLQHGVKQVDVWCLARTPKLRS